MGAGVDHLSVRLSRAEYTGSVGSNAGGVDRDLFLIVLTLAFTTTVLLRIQKIWRICDRNAHTTRQPDLTGWFTTDLALESFFERQKTRRRNARSSHGRCDARQSL